MQNPMASATVAPAGSSAPTPEAQAAINDASWRDDKNWAVNFMYYFGKE